MRSDKIEMLKDTLNVFENGYYEVNGKRKECKLTYNEILDCQVYLPEDIEKITLNKDYSCRNHKSKMEVHCFNMDSFSLARKINKPVLVLNLANAVHPGGGVRRGATAQEEDLCRKSSLLLSLEGNKAHSYYRYNRNLNTRMGSNGIIITPKVEIIKDEKGFYLEDSVVVSVMTCAAPSIKYGLEDLSQEQYETMLYKRITGMLKIAAYSGYENLVLGAFGCGAFGNDAKLVSDLFYKAIKEFDFDGEKASSFFKIIDFAVLDKTADQYNFKEFSRNFNSFYETQMNDTDNLKYTFFWKENETYGEFSNWYPSPFVMDDFEYSCVEQYMMAQKAKLFHDSKRYTAILRANTPKEYKDLGKLVTPFDPMIWNAQKKKIVKEGNKAKYTQNQNLLKLLKQTDNSILAEASPYDKIWGIGLSAEEAGKIDPKDWPGENILGKVLMELRKEIKVSIRQIQLVNASCADLQVDVVVNAANSGLWAGGGICGVIFKKAGRNALTQACSQYSTPLKDGSAVITPAFQMKNAKAIIHAVGPNFSVTPNAFKELFDAYYNSLVVLKENNYHSISFPLISSGIFGGSLANPVAESTKQCCRAYHKFIKEYPDYEIDVKLCAFTVNEMEQAKPIFDSYK